MKRFFFALILSAAVCFSVSARAAPSAQAAILIDGRNGYTVFESNDDLELPMASTTKIMTALLTLEAAEVFDEAVLITPEMISVEGSSMGLHEGWQVRLSSLAAGMLLASGNDAANAAAMGLSHTRFVTPSGLAAPDHYSSARELAALAREAMKNERFAALVKSRTAQVEILSSKMTLTYENHNKLLRLCEGCIGVKTGYTKRAGRCLVSCCKRGGIRLFAVTLNAPDD